jgi:hypothetical protein
MSKGAILKALHRKNNPLAGRLGEDGEWEIKYQDLNAVYPVNGTVAAPATKRVDQKIPIVNEALVERLKAKDEQISVFKERLTELQGFCARLDRELQANRAENQRLLEVPRTEMEANLARMDKMRDEVEAARLEAQKARIDADQWRKDVSGLKKRLEEATAKPKGWRWPWR